MRYEMYEEQLWPDPRLLQSNDGAWRKVAQAISRSCELESEPWCIETCDGELVRIPHITSVQSAGRLALERVENIAVSETNNG